MKQNRFSDLDLPQQTEALNRVYQDYTLSFQVQSQWVAEHVHSHQIRTDLSPCWSDGRGVVALGLVAQREERAWLGGFGIIPAYRGRRLSGALLRECLHMLPQATRWQLEVVCQNHRAFSTYRRGGFEPTRVLAVLEGPAGPPQQSIQNCGEACWQRQPESLSRMPRLLLEHNRCWHQDGQIHWVEDGARWGDLPYRSHWRVSNEPVGSPLYQQLLRLGWREVARQWEMVYSSVLASQ